MQYRKENYTESGVCIMSTITVTNPKEDTILLYLGTIASLNKVLLT